MPTKTEYREYLASEGWQRRRKQFLHEHSDCNRCDLPRWLAIIVYDQDLHIHHKTYARVGGELDDDLEPLCRRCHEIETFGNSNLHAPRSIVCTYCETHTTFDLVDRLCDECRLLDSYGAIYLSGKLFPVFDREFVRCQNES